jgi:hypothetical protein
MQMQLIQYQEIPIGVCSIISNDKMSYRMYYIVGLTVLQHSMIDDAQGSVPATTAAVTS